MGKCYIDNRKCTGGRFYFCRDCLKAKQQNAEKIKNAKTPAELTAAHCLPAKNTHK
jgi:hypothetical protein